MQSSWSAGGWVFALTIAAGLWPSVGFAQAGEDNESVVATAETIDSRPGIVERFALFTPREPIATLILLVGGEGRLNVQPDSTEVRSVNFLARTRNLFVRRGFQVAVLDSPSDHPSLGDFRVTPKHASDIAAVIRFLRMKSSVPVWLVGTSRGSISAANGAARIAVGADAPDGVVLTSTVTTGGRNNPTTVYDTPLKDIRVPVLIVGHRDDGCRSSPFSGSQELVRALHNAPKAELLAFDGGLAPQSGPCDPLAPHGYFGIEEAVVDGISEWIRRAVTAR